MPLPFSNPTLALTAELTRREAGQWSEGVVAVAVFATLVIALLTIGILDALGGRLWLVPSALAVFLLVRFVVSEPASIDPLQELDFPSS